MLKPDSDCLKWNKTSPGCGGATPAPGWSGTARELGCRVDAAVLPQHTVSLRQHWSTLPERAVGTKMTPQYASRLQQRNNKPFCVNADFLK